MEWDKNSAFNSQYILENTMCASYLEKMRRIQTKNKSKECVHGAKCTRAVSVRNHCFDNWWSCLYIKALSQGNATTSRNWRAGAKATHTGSPQVCSSEFRGFSATLIYNEGQGALPKTGFAECCCMAGAESARLFTWQLLLKSQHCTGPRAEGTCGGSTHCWGQSPSTAGLPEQLQCSHPQGTRFSEELPFWRSPGSSRSKVLKSCFHKSLSCLLPWQVNGPLCPATWVNHLAFPWLTAGSELLAEHSLLFLLPLSPPPVLLSQGWLTRELGSGQKGRVLTLGDLQQASSKETQIAEEVYKGFFRNTIKCGFWSSLIGPKASGVTFPRTSCVFCIKH